MAHWQDWINESTKTAGRFQDDTLSHSQSRHWNVLISPFTSYFPPFLRPLGSGAKLSFYIKYDHVVSVSMETRITGWGLLCNSDGAKWRHSWGYLMIPSFYENTHTRGTLSSCCSKACRHRFDLSAHRCHVNSPAALFFPSANPIPHLFLLLCCSFIFNSTFLFFNFISHSFPPQTFFYLFFFNHTYLFICFWSCFYELSSDPSLSHSHFASFLSKASCLKRSSFLISFDRFLFFISNTQRFSPSISFRLGPGNNSRAIFMVTDTWSLSI